MFKLIADILEHRRQRRYWRYMRKLMDESGPIVVQHYPIKPKQPAASNTERNYHDGNDC